MLRIPTQRISAEHLLELSIHPRTPVLDSPGRKAGDRAVAGAIRRPIPGLPASAIRERHHRHRGAVFIIALAIIAVTSALLLVFGMQMRTEVIASANRVSSVQADGIEQGAEQWVLAQVEANTTPLTGSSTSTSTTTDITTIPCEALQVGTGYFWILHPDPTQDQTYAFGITDESAKLNLNTATSDQLVILPNMTQDEADAISTWPTSAGTAGTTVPYETVEQILLADTETPSQLPQILYGYDLNRDGVIDKGELDASNGAATTNGTTTDSRGILNYVTVFSTNAPLPSATGVVPPAQINPATGKPAITTGLINVNTAPLQVLMCLPGMTQSNAAAMIAARASNATVGSTDWVNSAIDSNTAQLITPYITGVSYQYSADIVAVSGDGRSFKRVRIVVDSRQQPAKIVYRKDLTDLGWPLPPEVRTSLRAGQGVPQADAGTSNQQAGGSVVH